MNERKSILFACYGLGIGGIEKCLVSLINVLPEAEFDIDLLVMNPEYALLPMIRRNVNMIDAFSYILNTEFTMQEIRKRGGLWKHRHMIFPYIEHRIRIKLGLPLWTQFKALEKEYDVAVAYSQNGLAPYYVMDKVFAKRKVLWYHNGAYEKTGKDYALDRKYYPSYDYVVGVSDFCAELLRGKFDFRDDQLVVLYNICDEAAILSNAEAFDPDAYDSSKIHLVSVGRLAPEKGADIALEACQILRKQGRNICWHWIGDGPMMDKVQQEIQKRNLSDCFILHGGQNNPYPYMKNADIFVQPSYYEAYSTTITEAKVLCKPIVATDVGAVHQQLIDGITGKIVPVSPQKMAEAICLLLDDAVVCYTFSQNLEKEKHLTKQNLEKYKQTVFA